jgi:hypothetical protein
MMNHYETKTMTKVISENTFINFLMILFYRIRANKVQKITIPPIDYFSVCYWQSIVLLEKFYKKITKRAFSEVVFPNCFKMWKNGIFPEKNFRKK